MKRVKLSSEQVKDNSTIRMKIPILTSIQYNDMKTIQYTKKFIRDDKGIKVTYGKKMSIFFRTIY